MRCFGISRMWARGCMVLALVAGQSLGLTLPAVADAALFQTHCAKCHARATTIARTLKGTTPDEKTRLLDTMLTNHHAETRPFEPSWSPIWCPWRRSSRSRSYEAEKHSSSPYASQRRQRFPSPCPVDAAPACAIVEPLVMHVLRGHAGFQ